MRALALLEPGAGLAVTELPRPDPGPGELLVRVLAASINPIDLRVSTGRYPWGRFDYPVVPGFDFAGTVEATASDAKAFATGDEVLGYWSAKRFHRGSWAEYMTVPESGLVVRKPESLSFDLAAALPLAAATALLCIEAVAPLAGHQVLIVGAGGAIGSYAVQLAHAGGATVLATGRPDHEQRLHDLGAAEVIDYVGEEVAEVVGQMRPSGVDALIDLVNDEPELSRLATLVRDGGKVASACFGANVDVLAERGICASNVIATHADPKLLERLVALVEAGKLTVTYDERRALGDVPAVLAELSSGRSRKTVIDVH
jgi:NADPH:quinone reductase-like Zn-dependent oxidoreductase